MLTTMIRTVILYLTVILSVRIMGKRQIGELQPVELVITILLSEIAAIPMQDNNIPLINSLVPVLLLISFEILQSVFSLKSVRFRLISEGNPLLIIRNGKLDQLQLRRLRLTVDDILSALRQKDVFDISEVAYAVMETNGSLSVLLKSEKQPLTAGDIRKTLPDESFPFTVVLDGRIIKNYLNDCGLSVEGVEKLIRENGFSRSDLLLMTATRDGRCNFIRRETK